MLQWHKQASSRAKPCKKIMKAQLDDMMWDDLTSIAKVWRFHNVPSSWVKKVVGVCRNRTFALPSEIKANLMWICSYVGTSTQFLNACSEFPDALFLQLMSSLSCTSRTFLSHTYRGGRVLPRSTWSSKVFLHPSGSKWVSRVRSCSRTGAVGMRCCDRSISLSTRLGLCRYICTPRASCCNICLICDARVQALAFHWALLSPAIA